MTLKKDPNSEEKLTSYLKNDMRNLVNFNMSSRKSENLHFSRKYVMFELKRYQRGNVVKNDLWFQKWHK